MVSHVHWLTEMFGTGDVTASSPPPRTKKKTPSNPTALFSVQMFTLDFPFAVGDLRLQPDETRFAVFAGCWRGIMPLTATETPGGWSGCRQAAGDTVSEEERGVAVSESLCPFVIY